MIWKTNLVITDKEQLEMEGYRHKIDMFKTYLSCDKEKLVKFREKQLIAQYPWLTGDRLKKIVDADMVKLGGVMCY